MVGGVILEDCSRVCVVSFSIDDDGGVTFELAVVCAVPSVDFGQVPSFVGCKLILGESDGGLPFEGCSGDGRM